MWRTYTWEAGTEATVEDVQAKLAAGRVNPLELAQRLDAANRSIDGVLQGVRDARAQAQRAQTMLQQTLLAAKARVSACEDFITARRGAVGPEARTRLAETLTVVGAPGDDLFGPTNTTTTTAAFDALCSFFDASAWSQAACATVAVNGTAGTVRCRCEHLITTQRTCVD